MEIDVEKTHFWLSYFTDDQVGDKIIKHYEKTMELLNYLHLANYSSVDHLIIIFLVFSPETYPETEKLYFRRKKKEIEIRINMDYEKLLQATESETLQLIAQTYLSAISRFLSKRKDFDYQRFYEDVQKLFVEKGYLHENEHEFRNSII